MKYPLFLIFFFFFVAGTVAQDSLTFESLIFQDTVSYSYGIDSTIFFLDNPKLNNPDAEVKISNLDKVVWPEQKNWIFYIIFFLALLVALVRYYYFRDMQEIFDGFFSFNLANQVFRGHELTPPFSYLLLNINYILAASLFLFLAIKELYPVEYSDLLLLGIIAGALSIIVLLRVLFFKIMGVIFNFGKELNLYNFHIGLIYKVLGISLLPLVIILAFAPRDYQYYVIIIGIAVVVAFLFYRYIRGFAIAKEYIRFYKFHFFLYICTLEIAPVVLIIKVLKSGLL